VIALDEDELEKRRNILFWVFLAVFAGTAVSTILVFVFFQTSRPQAIPLLKELIYSVVIQAALAVIALYRHLFILPATPKTKPPAKPPTEVLENVIIALLNNEIHGLRIKEAISRIEALRKSYPAVVSDRILATEIGLRGLVGHGHFIVSHVKELKNLEYKNVLLFESYLLRFGTRDGVIKAPPNFQKMDKRIRSLWLSLLALDCVSRSDTNGAREYFDAIDHNVDNEGQPELNQFDRLVAYAAIPNAISASFLGKEKIAAAYLDVARSIKKNAKEFGFAEYPHLAALADLHRAFVMVILGYGENLDGDYIRSLPGHAHIVARFCQVLSENVNCLATLELIGTKYEKAIKAQELSERLKKFAKKLRNNAVHVVGGLDREAAVQG
jgi:hypothetical protein